jgi:hypothetical protein
MKVLLFFLMAFPLVANQRTQGDCMQGNAVVVTNGAPSTTKVMQSYPSCTITVYVSGTLTLATIYSDNSSTPLGNPFNSNIVGHWFFYAANGRYDVQLSGSGIPAPFTLGDILLADPAGGGTTVSSVTGGTGITASPTTGAVVVTNTGVTSAVAGSGIGVSAATGAVTFSNTWGAIPSGTQTQQLQIQPNTGNNTTLQFSGKPASVVTDYAFPAQTPSVSLSAGSQSITLTPCPLGVNGTDTAHNLYISGGGGAGSAEAVPITGGTCTSGATTGTVIVTIAACGGGTCHSGGWTIQSASAGIVEARTASTNVVLVPAGTFDIWGPMTFPQNTTIICAGTGVYNTPTTTLRWNSLNSKMFNVIHDNFQMENCGLWQVGTAVAGNVGIYIAGSGANVPPGCTIHVNCDNADWGLLRNITINAFYNGIKNDGSGGSLDMYHIGVQNGTGDGIIANGWQGYWDAVLVQSNAGNGVSINLCGVGGSCGIGPFQTNVQTVNNGGWGEISTVQFFIAGGSNYFNFDKSGELRLNNSIPIIDSGYIRDAFIQVAGQNSFFGANTIAPGISTSAGSGPLVIDNIHFLNNNGIGIALASSGNVVSNCNILGSGAGGVAGNFFAIQTTSSNNNIITNVYANSPISLAGNNTTFRNNFITVSSSSPAVEVVSGLNVIMDGNFNSNGGAGGSIKVDSGVTLMDGVNTVPSGAVSYANTRVSLEQFNNNFPNFSPSVPTIASAATIAPTTPLAFISGTTTISTITAPLGYNSVQFCAIPSGLWVTNTSSNIALASTAVINKVLCFFYNQANNFWYPSY